MRKNTPMLWMAVVMICVLLAVALFVRGMFVADRVLLMLAAAVVACVWMVCESRVMRAYAPLVIREEPVEEKNKPPETDGK